MFDLLLYRGGALNGSDGGAAVRGALIKGFLLWVIYNRKLARGRGVKVLEKNI